MTVTVVRWLGIVPVMAAIGGLMFLIGQTVVETTGQSCASVAGDACVEGWHTALVGYVWVLGVLMATFIMVKAATALATVGKNWVSGVLGVLLVMAAAVPLVVAPWQELVGLTAAVFCGAVLANYRTLKNLTGRAKASEVQE